MRVSTLVAATALFVANSAFAGSNVEDAVEVLQSLENSPYTYDDVLEHSVVRHDSRTDEVIDSARINRGEHEGLEKMIESAVALGTRHGAQSLAARGGPARLFERDGICPGGTCSSLAECQAKSSACLSCSTVNPGDTTKVCTGGIGQLTQGGSNPVSGSLTS